MGLYYTVRKLFVRRFIWYYFQVEIPIPRNPPRVLVKRPQKSDFRRAKNGLKMRKHAFVNNCLNTFIQQQSKNNLDIQKEEMLFFIFM